MERAEAAEKFNWSSDLLAGYSEDEIAPAKARADTGDPHYIAIVEKIT
jgi:hypothetical protein